MIEELKENVQLNRFQLGLGLFQGTSQEEEGLRKVLLSYFKNPNHILV